jgi:hypothetical protein
MIAPWPNAAFALGTWFGICNMLWPQQEFRIPIVAGALMGLIPAGLDAAARPSINRALRAASNAQGIILAYRLVPFARFRNILIGAAFAAAIPLSLSRYDDVAVGFIAGLVAVSLTSLAIFGFWTARQDRNDANAT